MTNHPHGALVAPEYYNFSANVMDEWAARQPDVCALWHVHGTTGVEQKFTFAEMSRLSRRSASYFHSIGIRRGDRVLMMLPRIPQWWIAMLGLLRLGAVAVPATLQLTSREVRYRVESAGISAVLTDLEGIAKLDVFKGMRMLTHGSAPGWHSFDSGLEAADAAFEPERTRADDPRVLYFTSATTGNPKMVVHSHASYGLGHRLTGQFWLDLKPGDLHWNISDLGWAKAAWSSFFGPWQMGASIFALEVHGKFDARLTLDTLAHYPITTWCTPPTALRLIVREDLTRWKFPHLRHCVTAGEPLNPEILRIWKNACGLDFYEAYGQTETVALVGNFRCTAAEVRPGSMGKAMPGFEIAIVDDLLNVQPDGHEGEIAVRIHPKRPLGLFLEYWKNEDEMNRQFQGEWYLTGDRAVRDANGYFWFIGRKDDVIKSSGYRIGPFEVESAMLEHPAVLEVAVVGKPDVVRGQIVKAFVVMRHGIEGTEQLKLEMQQHCKRTVAPYKYPREIEFVPDLPKTTSGKTRRVELRQRDACQAPMQS